MLGVMTQSVHQRWGHTMGSREIGVANGSRKMKKFGGICNGYPEGSNKLIKEIVQNKLVV